MAGFLDLIDDTLGTHFHTPVYKPETGRAKLVRQIDLAAKQHSEGTTRAPNRAWAAGNNEGVSFSPKIDGNPVLINDRETNYIHKSRFQDFLKELKAAVEKGDLDKEIKAAIDSDDTNKLGISRGTRASAGGGGKGTPITAVRQSIGKSLSAGLSLADAEAVTRAKGKYDGALIDQVVAEKKAQGK